MTIPANIAGIAAVVATGICAIIAAAKVCAARTRYNDARLMCLIGLLAIELPMIAPIHGAAEAAVGVPGVLAVVYGVIALRRSYAARLSS